MGLTSGRRTITWVAIVAVAAVALVTPAIAETAVSHHLKRLHRVETQLRKARTFRRHHVDPVAASLNQMQNVLDQVAVGVNDTAGAPAATDTSYRHAVIGVARNRSALRHLSRRVHRRIRQLLRRRRELLLWMNSIGVLQRCPVVGWSSISNDFGAIVHIEKVKPHPHMGNDIAAPYGASIVTPFDGYAAATESKLGGMAVRVWGPLGHVYNAHLSAYGRLGAVKAGDVIGYVGATGDASSSHDHFEWHPYDGPAVDPHPFLLAACG